MLKFLVLSLSCCALVNASMPTRQGRPKASPASPPLLLLTPSSEGSSYDRAATSRSRDVYHTPYIPRSRHHLAPPRPQKPTEMDKLSNMMSLQMFQTNPASATSSTSAPVARPLKRKRLNFDENQQQPIESDRSSLPSVGSSSSSASSSSTLTNSSATTIHQFMLSTSMATSQAPSTSSGMGYSQLQQVLQNIAEPVSDRAPLLPSSDDDDMPYFED